jgi:MFS-type transporter involved in bile tolerance (Atg22 family)
MNFAGQTGAFFLAIVFGKIADITHNFQYPLFVVAGVLGIGFLLWLLINPLQQISMVASDKSSKNAEQQISV